MGLLAAAEWIKISFHKVSSRNAARILWQFHYFPKYMAFRVSGSFLAGR
jgi:hypothetical protein